MLFRYTKRTRGSTIQTNRTRTGVQETREYRRRPIAAVRRRVDPSSTKGWKHPTRLDWMDWKKQNPLQRKHPSIHLSIHRSSKINRTKTPMSHERPCVHFIDDEKCTRVNHSEIRNLDNTRLFTHIRSRRERCESNARSVSRSSG